MPACRRGYAYGRACCSYLTVYGPAGTLRAEVVDVCPDCAAATVDLSRAAFARIANPGNSPAKAARPGQPPGWGRE